MSDKSAAAPGLSLLPDANFFLQCRAIRSLPWEEFAARRAIELLSLE